MDLTQRVVRIQKCLIAGRRPRAVGCNARLGPHGDSLTDPVVRLHVESGAVGVGWSRIEESAARALLGRRLDELFLWGGGTLPAGATEAGAAVDIALWDLAARLAGLPLYRLLGGRGSREVEMYDGSLYIDDLGLDDAAAVRLFRSEVASGQAHGLRNFKIKVGRGARWMPVMDGLARDALVIRAVREAAGPDAKVLIDANMGNTLNTARELLLRCRDAGLHWFEEPFAEDPPINSALKDFLRQENLNVLIADGEHHPPPSFFGMVEEGLIDVIQHDLRGSGLTWWHGNAPLIERMGGRCAPHCWGSVIDRYFNAHFGASVPHYALLEVDTAAMPELVLDGWETREGRLLVPDTPGAGVDVEPEALARLLRAPGAFDARL